MDIVRDLRVALERSGLGGQADRLAGLATPSVWLRSTAHEAGEVPSAFRRVEAVEGLEDVVAVASSGYHTLALRADGTVVAWGSNDCGQLGDGTRRSRAAPGVVAGLTDAVAVAVSLSHSVALRADGTVMAWGANDCGQLGDGTREQRVRPVQGQAPEGVRMIAAGKRVTCAITTDGALWQAGASLGADRGRPGGWRPVDLAGVDGGLRAVALADYHRLALRADHSVLAWGSGRSGALGEGTAAYHDEPRPVSGVGRAVACAAGMSHSVALLADGSVMTWGGNLLGQLGDGTTTGRARPGPVVGLTGRVVALAVRSGANLALLDDGTVLGWGSGHQGILGGGRDEDYSVPVPVEGLRGVVAIAPGVALLADGTVRVWGGEAPTTSQGPADLPVGATKLGGHPDLPQGMGWPQAHRRPLAFIAQIDLAGLPALAGRELLPEAGLLSFFCAGSDDLEPGRVILTPPGARLRRLHPPEDLPDAFLFAPTPLRAQPHTSLVSNLSTLLEPLGLSPDEHDAYQQAYWDHVDALSTQGPIHRLLGHPDLVQPDADDTAVLLLQVDSDDTAGMMWGDEGRLYYWITPDDLRHERFERAWMRAQSH